METLIFLLFWRKFRQRLLYKRFRNLLLPCKKHIKNYDEHKQKPLTFVYTVVQKNQAINKRY